MFNLPAGCITEDPCAGIVCENNGTCADGTCICPNLFSGDRCETAISQVWNLAFSDGGTTPHFQEIEIQINFGTTTATFSETATSQGLWMYDAGGQECYRLTVEGMIVHDSPDRWTFIGMTGAGCGMQTLGSNSTGLSNSNFPYSTGANGTVILTTQSPLGTASGEVNWFGIKR